MKTSMIQGIVGFYPYQPTPYGKSLNKPYMGTPNCPMHDPSYRVSPFLIFHQLHLPTINKPSPRSETRSTRGRVDREKTRGEVTKLIGLLPKVQW